LDTDCISNDHSHTGGLRLATPYRGTPFVILMLVAMVWSLANALEMAGTDLPTKLFWANVQYLC